MNICFNHTCKRIGFTSILLMLISFISMKAAFGQENGLSNIRSKFNEFRKNNLQEKLYVQTNKDFYVAGEIVWFGIFDINGATNAPFDFSKVVYVELLDKNNTPVLQTKVSLDKNNGGSLKLPLTLYSGTYTFRAYTSWMKNFSPEFYFHKNITIVNTTIASGLPVRDSAIKYKIHFFPEGGNLVNGLKSVVAFKVTNQYGDAVDFKGAVVDQNNDTIIHFQPFKWGMGRFAFTPEEGNLYRAVIQTAEGQQNIEDMPVAYNQGYVLHLEPGSNKQIKLTVTTNIPSQQNAYLLIHTRESVKVAEVLSFMDGKAELTVDKNKLGAGISQITLFNSERQPVCERLYFKPVKKKLNIQLHTGRQQATRKKVNLAFYTTDEKGKPAAARMAVSVYKLDSLQTTEEGNIVNYLWLRSELSGKVIHPARYFRDETDSTLKMLDNLMLTRGWRRFDWSKVLQGHSSFFQYAPEPEGPVISGKIIDAKKHTSAANALVYLAIPGKHVQLYRALSNAEGQVYFNMKDFYGPHQIVVRANPHSKNNGDEIKIRSPFSEKYLHSLPVFFPVNRKYKNLLESHSLWMQVAHAYHDKERARWHPSPADTVAFYGKPYKTYLLDNYTRYVTMEEVMREYVMEVAVRKEKQHYHFKVVNALFTFDERMSSTLFGDDPLVLFDGVPVFDIDKVIAYDPLKVKKIEVVAGRYFYGPVTADGIVSYTTYKGNLEDYPLDPHAVVLDYDGLQRQRIFYSPEDKNIDTHIPDFRNALFWSPKIHTDSTGHAECTFYTSDLTGKYAIVVNGITNDGRAGSQIMTFTTKK